MMKVQRRITAVVSAHLTPATKILDSPTLRNTTTFYLILRLALLAAVLSKLTPVLRISTKIEIFDWKHFLTVGTSLFDHD